ncbi:MAG: hypothetical protein DMG12_24590 [Acidobacteria bacterium]|nr:MAG: hypothetical protein DMG12_24590 [Acidobacteriota bacterium]
MDAILFWALIAGFTALTGMVLTKYVGVPGASVIMGLVLWVTWIAGFSRLFESVSRLSQQLVTFVLSSF